MAGTTTYYGISYPTSTDYVKDGATAMQTIATGFDSAVAIPTYNNQTGTSYTFVLADAGKTVTSNNASAVTFTIPPQASVAWADNTTLTVRNLGAGVVTIAGGAGVTVTNATATLSQYTSARIIRTASNAWTVIPESAPSGLTLITSQTLSASSTGVSFTNVFTSTYSHYRLVLHLNAGTNGAYLNIRARMNTTDYTSASGHFCSASYLSASAGTWTNFISNNQVTGWNNITRLNSTANTFSIYGIDLIPSGSILNYGGTGADGYFYGGPAITGGYIGASSTITGLTLYPSTGTITGVISLYGYQK